MNTLHKWYYSKMAPTQERVLLTFDEYQELLDGKTIGWNLLDESEQTKLQELSPEKARSWIKQSRHLKPADPVLLTQIIELKNLIISEIEEELVEDVGKDRWELTNTSTRNKTIESIFVIKFGCDSVRFVQKLHDLLYRKIETYD